MSTDYHKIVKEHQLPNTIPVQEENEIFNGGMCFFEKDGKNSIKCISCGFTVLSLQCKLDSLKRRCSSPKTKKEISDQLIDSLPPFIIRFGKFGREFLRHIASGAKRRTDAEIKKIFETYCLQCKPYYDKERGICLKCSCNVNDDTSITAINKISWQEQKCPVDKW